jgi:hypothetical protein
LFSEHPPRGFRGCDPAAYGGPPGAGFGQLDIFPRFPEGERKDDEKDELQHGYAKRKAEGGRRKVGEAIRIRSTSSSMARLYVLGHGNENSDQFICLPTKWLDQRRFHYA